MKFFDYICDVNRDIITEMRKIVFFVLALVALSAAAQHLVILHTNDTHSNIDDVNGVGGVLQRKAIVDSVRRAEKNVMLVDAGDIVQGPLYFKLFGGKVEYPLMDLMGYDIQILGNHEFDNGLDSIAAFYPYTKSVKLSSNYDFSDTKLRGVFRPYYIKKIGGKKVGFLGLNLDPYGIISPGNYDGMKFTDIIEAANATADYLRDKEKCDVIVAVSHIGYENNDNPELTTDPMVAANTRNIDIIIGGHSHTLVDPAAPDALPSRFRNLDGKEVLVAQTGRYGEKLGKIDIDLADPSKSKYSLIDVKGVDPKRYDRRIVEFLKPYKHHVDSVNARPVGMAAHDMMNSKKYAESVGATNMISDIAQWYGSLVLDSLRGDGGRLPLHSDLGIMNSGGVRRPLQAGVVTEGQVYSAFPFPNRFWIMKFSGRQLDALLRQAVKQKGIGVSGECVIAVSPTTGEIEGITISGAPIDPERDYYVTTIDYLGKGSDYMDSFKAGELVWSDDKEMCAPVMRYVVEHNAQGVPLGLSDESRIVEAQHTP